MPGIRSESRTEETSGLVVMMASSAKVKRHQRTGFNACRGITDDEIEFHFLQFFENLVDAFASQSVFIPGLGSRENVEIFRALIFNQRLVQCGIALNDVDEIINDATFAAHNQVEVTQADVEVDNDGFFPFWAKPVAMAALEVVLPTPLYPKSQQ